LNTAVVLSLALFTGGCASGCRAEYRQSKIDRITYHGWTNALRLSSATAEVIVVPEIGRVMSFRFLDGENVFWEDRSLDGQRSDPTGKEWINFGGDKTWPAPEAEWGRYTGRQQWMPPSAFDSMAVEASITNHEVVLTSPVDPHYGVRTVRRMQLWGSHLRIDTAYERVSGEPSKMGIWVITQFKDPRAIYVPVKTNSILPDGYFKFGNEPWSQFQRKGDFIEITRDPKAAHKMGSDADRLWWVGEKEICVVTSPRVAGAAYPDRGASAEVYTNPDPKKYVELELLGPLSTMRPGDRISATSTYMLSRRTGKTLEAELQALGELMSAK
jgi:hypothetical protein